MILLLRYKLIIYPSFQMYFLKPKIKFSILTYLKLNKTCQLKKITFVNKMLNRSNKNYV